MPVALRLLLGLFIAAIFSLSVVQSDGVGVVPSLIASALVIPLAAVLVMRIAGTPRVTAATLPWGWASMFGMLVLAASGLTMMLVKARPWWLPSAIGLGLSAVVFVAVSVLWFLPMRSIHRVRSFAGDPEKLESAAASLVASFDKAVPTSAIGLRRRGIRALAAVGALCDVQQFERAGRVLDLVEPNSMTGDLRAMLYLSRSTVALHFGARDAAFAALKEAAAASTGRVQLIGDIIVINSALLDAMDGRGSEALGRLTELGEPKEPGLRRAWHVARAHAFASNGDDDAARAAVEDVVRLAPEALARSAHLPGPAQRLFEEAYQSRQIIASSSQSFGP